MTTDPTFPDPPLRITMVLDRPRTGGAEVQTFSLMRALAHRGHQVDLLCLNADTGAAIDLPPDIPTAHLGFERTSDVKGWRALAQRVNRQAPDLVYGVNTMPMVMLGAARAGFGLKAPVVTSFHSTGFANAGERNRFILIRASLLAVHTLVYVSGNQRLYWRRRGVRAQRDTVIHNGVDLQRFEPITPERRAEARAAINLQPTEVVVALSARFRPEKNHIQLVEAVRRLRAEGKPFTALFVGDGPTRPSVEAAVREQGAEAFVRLVGQHPDVRPYLAAADISVLTSTNVETFSIAALEAMAMGLPLVLSDIGGASEMVTPGENGQLFRAGDTDTLVECLRSLGDAQTRQRMGRAGRQRVIEAFSEQQMVDRYLALFHSVAQRARR